jgi:hypothetical protein
MKKIVLVIVISATAVLLTRYYFQKKMITGDPRGNTYTGSVTCIRCHQTVYNSYLHTAHYLASLPASEKTIGGSFAKDSNL